MLTRKTFLKKTKSGNVMKIVREHYLRDDISCGISCCKICASVESYASILTILDDPSTLRQRQKSFSGLYADPHYLILDTNVVLHQIDILEADVIKNAIILQTVIEEVKHKSSSIYKRLLDIVSNEERKFYVFVNEHHKDTYVERRRGESANDRNDRAIRVAASWYANHMKEGNFSIKIVLITDDNDNRIKAKDEGVLASSAEEYVKSLKNSAELRDKLSKYSTPSENAATEGLFPAHLTLQRIQEGVKCGKLSQGSFQASRENYLEGFVNVEGMEKLILVQGFTGLNRAIDGDVVAVEIFPEDQWTCPSELILEDTRQDAEGDVLEDGPINEKPVVKRREEDTTRPTGRVVGIIRRKWRQYCGILQANNTSGATRHLFVPAERKIPKIRVETRQYDALNSQRIIVAIDSWPLTSRYPLGHFVRALGPIGDKNTENEVLLLEHDIPHSAFSNRVKSFLPKMPWTISEKDMERREDLRHLNVCSVDPKGCTDIDDALHCRELENGNFEVGVHIADVSYFIRPGTALDDEAALRGTTVYLRDKRIGMVPELLSSNLCSLRGNEERLAFSCIWEMKEDSQIVSTRFVKSVILSKAALTYEQAQMLIDDTTQVGPVAGSLRRLNALAKILKRKRMGNGALVLASPQVYLNIDSETLNPTGVQCKELLETNSMVEEFMLLANGSVARRIYEEFPDCAILRRHPPPPPANFEPLVKAAKHLGFEMNANSGRELSESLDKAVKEDNPYFNTMLRFLTTRCMQQAVYFASGTIQYEDYAHYGLAVPIYTHFTSPIRRYADILVHRLLAVCIGADATYPDLLDKKKANGICNNLNYRNRMAQYADRASTALNVHIYFKDKIQDEEGYVLFVRKNALQILIPKYGLEGTLFLMPPAGKKAQVSFTYNDRDCTQRCGNIVFHAFDPVVVRVYLDRANIQHEKIVLQLVKPEIPKFSIGPTTKMET